MGLFDRLFGSGARRIGDERLQAAVDQVIARADPRLQAVRGARQRLVPAVAQALAFAGDVAGQIPSSVRLSPENWAQTPLLRAVFARPADIAETLAGSEDLRNFLATQVRAEDAALLFGLVAATRAERTVLGSAIEGDMLRQDVAQKTVSFGDFRLVALAWSEAGARRALADLILDQLVLAALHEVAGQRLRSDQLGAYRQLLLTRLQLLQRSAAGLEPLPGGMASGAAADLERLHGQLAANAAELASLHAAAGLEGCLEPLLGALGRADEIIQPRRIALRLNAMNVIVDDDAANASIIELDEFSTVNPERPRRVGFLASFQRDAVSDRRPDLDALLRTL